GKTWEQGKHNRSPLATLHTTTNENIQYTVTLEAHHRKWLYALDIPSKVPADIVYTSNYNLRSRQSINNLYQYKISSVLEYFNPSEISPWEKSAGLKIPLNSNPETLLMAKNLAQQFKNKEDIVNYVLQYFNQQNFHYTLRPPLTPGFNSVDQFLFETKSGFCEHYASSFTLLMRAAGIPARIVLGFQGGTLNPLNNILTVANSDAHAWSEVWLENRGWVRIDPTAAIAPQRIELNLNAALDQTETRPFHMQINSGFIKDVLFYWDAMDNQWNLWVIGYDKKFQEKFLENIFNKKIEISDAIIIMICCFAVLLLALSIFILKPWQKKKFDPEVKIYNDFCNKLASRGLIRAPHEGPLDFANRAKMALPEKAQSIEQITRLFTALRFEKSHHKQQYNQLRDQVRRFKLAKR
ncbi:MAG: transglutaminaseTgpA domain-containing protein, partial [Gammaproteobacteria bacterium]|nr:transglutaminaseTgpA domain-containing protein [Gammaproteobacteria bacterium]